MTVLRQTLAAFPLGRTTEQLMALLDVDFDPNSRRAIIAELEELQAKGEIRRDRRGKWSQTSSRFSHENGQKLTGGVAPDRSAEEELLTAAPARFAQSTSLALTDENEGADVPPNAGSLLRYWRSALRADPRGATTGMIDRHGSSWQLVSGAGPMVPEAGNRLTLSIELDNLAPEFRQALLKREAEDQSLAIGWPLAVGRKSGVPVVWPVGMLSGEWNRTGESLEVTIEADDVLVNPDWLAGSARSTGWSKTALSDVFVADDMIGLAAEDFLQRLREASAGYIRGKLTGLNMVGQLDPERPGICDMAALFLPTDSTFTAGAARDLDAIATWSEEKLSGTALAQVFDMVPIQRDVFPSLNTGPLNAEQIDAVRQACSEPLSVVTGPPGTGKSQAIVSMAASVLAQGGSVLVASKNHQALEAVEDRLGGLAPESQFLVRTLDPARSLDQSFFSILKRFVSQLSPASSRPVDEALRMRLRELAKERSDAMDDHLNLAHLECEIAAVIERIAARKRHSEPSSVPLLPATTGRAGSFSAWLFRAFTWLFRIRKEEPLEDTLREGAPLASLEQALGELRSQKREIGKPGDPVQLTDEIAILFKDLLPSLLSARTALSEDNRQAFDEALAELEFSQKKTVRGDLAFDILERSPLWLASVLGTPNRIPLEAGLFDLVIFDEASQCDIASAIPLFARAKRAVIVGDDKQLNFIPQLGQAQDRNLMQAQNLPVSKMMRFAQSRQSLFDFARRVPGAKRVLLRHQYRSAEAIVNYISGNFYGKQLRVAYDVNSMQPPKGQKTGIAWTHVHGPSGPQSANVNRAEIEAIADHLERLLVKESYKGSIGVISPFRPQVHALEETIRARLPSQKLEGADFRVATVDGFQGQERDLVLFSPCLHSASMQSAVTFVQKDPRRLNVAISRARAVAHVFGDLDYARTGKVRALARLASAATEPRARTGEGVFDSDWERRVYHAMKDRGLEPTPQFEIAGRRLDFALFGANDIKLDVEVDGRTWHEDADGKRKQSDLWRDAQLKSMGWRVCRFWVDELDKDMESCLERVEQHLS